MPVVAEPEKGARKITFRSTAALIPYAKNPRTHSEFQVQQIAASIKRFGFTNPILLNGNLDIIAGHGRLLAAQALGMEQVPCIDLHGLSPEEQRAYVIADNQLALAAGWDLALLAAEIQAIAQDGIDISLLGFSEAEMATIESLGAHIEEQEQWQGMPEFDQQGEKAFRRIIMYFKDQNAVDEFVKATNLKITPATRYAWFPETEIFHGSDYRYQTDNSDQPPE